MRQGVVDLITDSPEPRHAHRAAELPGFCLLLARNGERLHEMCFRLRCVPTRRLEFDFSRDAVDLGLAPPFAGCLRRRKRLANAAPSIVQSNELDIGACQI
jgi:hypothetical protein